VINGIDLGACKHTGLGMTRCGVEQLFQPVRLRLGVGIKQDKPVPSGLARREIVGCCEAEIDVLPDQSAFRQR